MGIFNPRSGDEVVEALKIPKGFEVTATYARDGDARVMTSLSVASGKVLIVPKVYNVDGITLSTRGMKNVSIKLYCHKIGRTEDNSSTIIEGSEHWEAWLESPLHSRTLASNERILDGFEYVLLAISDGVLVTDNRKLICLNTTSITMPGKHNVEYMGQIDCVQGIITECPFCSGLPDTIEMHTGECEEMLGKLGG